MKFYFISPIGYTSPLLYESFVDAFQQKGHTITSNIVDADVAFFDTHSGFAPYYWNVLDIVLGRRMPIVIFDAFDYHGDSSKHWHGFNNWEGLKPLLNQEWAKFVWQAYHFCTPFIYFMRKMNKDVDYGKFVYPLELCIYPDHNFPTVEKKELLSRIYDFTFIGASSPRRANLVSGLLASRCFKVNYLFTTERIPHSAWLDQHRKSKFFIEASGGGIGSERPYQLITISPMLRGRTKQLIANNFIDGIDCIEAGDDDGMVSPEDTKKLIQILSDDDKIYDIYLKGIEKMKTHFSWEARSNYILDVLKQNGVC